MSMRSFSRPGITRRLFNTPLAVLPSTAAIVLGVVGPRFDVSQLLMHAAGHAVDIDQLQADAQAEHANIEARRTSAERRPDWTAAHVLDLEDGVAHINIRGELVAENGGGVNPSSGFTGYDAVMAAWTIAQRDPNVRGVLVDVDSPGGEVTDLNELTAVMMADRGKKPSRAIIRGVGASAAYAIASCCDEVTVQDLGYAGSVGVICMHADFSGQLEQAGVKVTLIHAGAHKADGNPFEPLPADVRDAIQADVGHAYDRFVAHVAAARGMSEAAVRATEARVFQGQQAVDAGLADKVMSWRDSQAEFVAVVNGRKAAPQRNGSSPTRASMETKLEPTNDAPAATNQPETTEAENTAAAQTATAEATALEAATGSERSRVLALIDLCPASNVSASLRSAIEQGKDAGAFAIDLAQAAKARGASMDQLRAGAVQPEQVPQAPAKAGQGTSTQPQSMLQRMAAMGHRGLTHLNKAG